MIHRPRLLLVASWYPSHKFPLRGTFVREQALALLDRGYDVHVASFDRDRPRLPLRWTERQDETGLVEHYLGAVTPLHRLIGFYCPTLFAVRLRALIRRLHPHVVHAHAVRPAGVVAALAVRGGTTPLVLTEHSGPLTAFWKTSHGYRQIAQAFAACDVKIAVSHALRRNVECLFPGSGPWRVVPNGIDLNLFHPSDEGEARQRDLLFVGGLEPVKSVETILRALALLPAEIGLTVVGTGSEQARLQAMAHGLGLAHRVRWAGSLPRAQVAAVMRRHAALVVASTTETFSLVAAEALASGTPVVATRCGGPEEVIPPQGGVLVPIGDATAIADAVRDIFSGRLVYSPQTLRSHVSEHFSVSAVVDCLEQAYTDAMERKTSCAA